MKKYVMAGLIVACGIMIIVSFFMPWARANVSVTKVAKGLTSAAEGTLKDSPFAGKFIKDLQKATDAIDSMGNIEVKTTVSGYDIPTMVNKKSSKSAISLAQVFFAGADDLDKKSMLVYLMPALAIVCIFFALLAIKTKLFAYGTAIIGAVIAAYGYYHLLNTNLVHEQYQIVILNGLWQTMLGYLLICILSIVWLVIDKE